MMNAVPPAAVLMLAAYLAASCTSSPFTTATRSWDMNISAFERETQDLQSALAIPGLAYVIIRDGEPIASSAFGTVQGPAKEPFTITTPLRIASVTKTITAVVVMQLVEEGRLDLDAPARRYVPDLAVPENVLVKHLLTHTSEGMVGEDYVYGSTRYAMCQGPALFPTGVTSIPHPFSDVKRLQVSRIPGCCLAAF